MVEIHFEDVEVLDLSPEFFISWLSNVCVSEGEELGDLNLVFCSDEYLLKMNIDFLEHDYYTDIITFDYSDEVVSGDLFISYERVLENSNKNNEGFKKELYRVIVHGVLHLLGYHDKTMQEAATMRDKEDYYLEDVPRGTFR